MHAAFSSRWREPTLAAALLLAALPAGCGRPVLSLDNAIVHGDRAHVVAYVDREVIVGFRRHVAQAIVEFYADDRLLGSATSGKDGRAALECKLPADADEQVEARVTLDGQVLETEAVVFPWNHERTVIVVDVDGTIAQTNARSLIFKRVDRKSRPRAGAREVLNELARDFDIAYMTSRPRFLLDKTRRWLADNGFPAGPVFTAPGLRAGLGDEAYKRAMLAELRRRWPNVRIGIGDSPGDAEAYEANGMLSLIVTRSRAERYPKYAHVLRDWQLVGRFLATYRATFGASARADTVRSWPVAQAGSPGGARGLPARPDSR